MKRRRFSIIIASLFVGSGGCLTEGANERTTSQANKSASKTETKGRVSVAKTTAKEISVESEILESTITEDHPPKIRISFQNTTDKPITAEISDDSPELLPSHIRENGDWKSTGLLLVPPSYEVERTENCWKPVNQLGGGGAPESNKLSPGESFSNEYNIWTSPGVRKCFEAGTYDFGHFGSGPPSWKITIKVAPQPE